MERKTLLYRFIPLLSILMGLLIWEIIGHLEISKFIPPFSDVLKAWFVILQDHTTYLNLVQGLKVLFYGFGLAAVIGVPFGLLLGSNKKFYEAFGVIINGIQGAPMIAFVPVLMILFGTGVEIQISVVFLFSFFVICIGAESGAKNVDANLLEMAKSFGASNFMIMYRLILPSSLRFMFSGLYMGIIRGLQGLVTAQMLVTLKGIGADVKFYGATYKVDYLFATILNILILAIVLGGLIRFISDYILNKTNQGGIHNVS